MGTVKPDELVHGLEVIERNANIQTQLIDELLDVSRIISGKMRLEMQAVRLPEVIEAALAVVAPMAQAKGVRFEQALDVSAGPISGDAGRLQQVVWNLLTNAVKFTPPGGRVKVGLERSRYEAELTIADNGAGIKPDFLPYVFDRFRQADGSTTRSHGGLGLGLSIVRQLVELHGGTVRVDSPGEGQGSTFHVALPISLRESADSPRDDSRHASKWQDGPRLLRGVRILIVDDEPDARDMLARLLAERGALVRAAGSAAEALAQLAEFRPQILISDIGMPEQDGYDLIRRIREQGLSAKQMPAVALTAFARADDRQRALSAGYQVHVAKPVNARELTAVLASLAEGQ
jgi:CheY-like chemotaxis protein/two-component sensor histidine kinase